MFYYVLQNLALINNITISSYTAIILRPSLLHKSSYEKHSVLIIIEVSETYMDLEYRYRYTRPIILIFAAEDRMKMEASTPKITG